MPPEYAPYGDGWVKRDSPEGDWQEVAEGDVPTEDIAKHNIEAERHAQVAKGIHPDGGTPFAEIRRVSEGEAPFTAQ